MKHLVSLLVFLLAVTGAIASLDNVFTAEDATRVKALILSSLKDGSFGNIEKTHFAVSSLGLLKESVPSTQQICNRAKESLTAAKDLESLYHAVGISSTLNCGHSLSSDQQKVIQRGLDSKILSDIFFASQIVLTLNQATSYSLGSVVANVAELFEDDGLCRSSPDREDGSAVNAGLALQVVGSVLSKVPSLREANKDYLDDFIALVDPILTPGTDDVIDLTKNSNSDGLSALSTVLRGINALAALDKNLDVSEEQLASFGASLLKAKFVHNVAGAYHLLHGLSVIANNPISVPLVLTLAENDPQKLAVRVTDVLGQPVAVSVALEQAQLGSQRTLRDLPLKPSGDVYLLDNAQQLWRNADAGLYSVRFRVTPSADERFKEYTTERMVKVLAKIDAMNIEVSVSESAKGKSDDAFYRESYPKALSKELSADQDKYLHVRLEVRASGQLSPSQVFLQLAKGEQTTVFVPQVANNQFTFKLNLGSTDFLEHVYGSGQYEVRVLVGDAALPSTTVWNVARLTLNIGEAESKSDPFAVPPEIDHIFQSGDERAPFILPLIFAGVVLLPFVYLLVGLCKIGVKVDLPSNTGEWLFTLLFLACLVCILVLNLLYWLWLNILQALGCLALLAIPTIFFGNRALKQRYQRRTAVKEHAS